METAKQIEDQIQKLREAKRVEEIAFRKRVLNGEPHRVMEFTAAIVQINYEIDNLLETLVKNFPFSEDGMARILI